MHYPINYRPYWGVVVQHGDRPLLMGSQFGTVVDAPHDHPHKWGRVFSNRQDAIAWMEAQPTHYKSGRPKPVEDRLVACIETRDNGRSWSYRRVVIRW